MNLLQLENVHKKFGDFTAVSDISFAIEKGSIYGLLGPNGAGKTTTLRMIMDIIAPDAGSITFSGNRHVRDFLDQIGYLPEERGLYRKMKVRDVILFIAELKGLYKQQALGEIEQWLEKMQLSEWGNKRVDELSKGMAQKIQFITTVIHKPELIILDEPFSGLDPINMTLLKDLMLELRDNGSTIIFSTHVMEQVEKLCDRICLIHQGKVLLEGELRAVKRAFGKNSVEIEYVGSLEPIMYSTLYAIVGAICNSEEEAQQTGAPLPILLIVPLMLMFSLFRIPDSTLSVLLSHIPFFSPILMFMRINVLMPPLWEILLNILLMCATVLLVTLVSAKIYRVGILMYGKRPTLGQLWQWTRY